MRKIPTELENPIDNIILSTSDTAVDFFYKIGFTPNGLTTLSLLTGLLSIKNFKNEHYYWSAFWYFVSYYFDCLDGHMARKYNMISVFGDYYDHIKDLFIAGLLVYHIVKTYYRHGITMKNLLIVLAIIGLVGYLSGMQIGCQEIYYDSDDETKTIDLFKHMCPHRNIDDVKNVMRFTRFGGTGTLTLTICILIAMTNRIYTK